MNQKKVLGELYGFGIEQVPGNRVDEKNIGVTEFGEKKIKIPSFSNVLERVYTRCRERYNKYKEIANYLSAYILGHEAYVEVLGKPRNGMEHSLLEKDYMESLRQEYPLLYLVGTALHDIRLKYGDETGFSRNIKNYIKGRVSECRELIKELREPLAVLLGLEPVPEYAFEKVRS